MKNNSDKSLLAHSYFHVSLKLSAVFFVLFALVFYIDKQNILEITDKINLNSKLSEHNHDEFMEELIKLNGDIFWAPASKDLDKPVTLAGDQARAVFGEFPDETFNCAAEDAVPIHIEVNGNQAKLKPDPITGKLRFQHCPPGVHTTNQCIWTDTIEKCDKPSLAGNVTFCGTASRIVKRSIGPVDWMLLCRKSKNPVRETPEGKKAEILYAEDYWSENNPFFKLYGLIAYNNISGEVAFFDGQVRNNHDQYTWNDKFLAPGGKGYDDEHGRKIAELFYDDKFTIDCHMCHDNKNPWTVTPHLNQSHVGYNDRVRRASFSNDIVPKLVSMANQPYRIIGTSYIDRHCLKGDKRYYCKGKAFNSPKSNLCTTCHSLTTFYTGLIFSYDSYNKTNKRILYGEFKDLFWNKLAESKTKWSNNFGELHYWMPNKQTSTKHLNKTSTWREVRDCINGTLTLDEYAKCKYRKLYTDCPIPGGNIDTRKPFNNSFTKHVDKIQKKVKLELSWEYSNDYGNVPNRDDVRFVINIKESNNIKHEEKIIRSIRNISHMGHNRYSDNEVISGGRKFNIKFTLECDRKYSIEIHPTRYCFSEEKQTQGEVFSRQEVSC